MEDRERIAGIIGKYHIGCNLKKACKSECALCAADALIEAGYTRQFEPKISPYEIPHAAYDKYFTQPELTLMIKD